MQKQMPLESTVLSGSFDEQESAAAQEKKRPDLKTIFAAGLITICSLAVFTVSFVVSSAYALLFKTVPETNRLAQRVWRDISLRAKQLWNNVEQVAAKFTLLRKLLFALRKLNEFTLRAFDAYYSVITLSFLRERWPSIRLQSSVLELLYSLVAMVIVCVMVALRFAFMSALNVWSTFKQPAEQPAETTPLDKMADYSSKLSSNIYSQPRHFDTFPRRRSTARSYSTPMAEPKAFNSYGRKRFVEE